MFRNSVLNEASWTFMFSEFYRESKWFNNLNIFLTTLPNDINDKYTVTFSQSFIIRFRGLIAEEFSRHTIKQTFNLHSKFAIGRNDSRVLSTSVLLHKHSTSGDRSTGSCELSSRELFKSHELHEDFSHRKISNVSTAIENNALLWCLYISHKTSMDKLY